MAQAPRAKEYWAIALAQSHRLMRITFQSEPALDREFVVAAWRGREAICEGFEHTVDLLTEDSSRPLKSLVGLPVCLGLETNTAGSSVRHVHGQVMRVEHRGADGGLARIRLIVVPFMTLLGLARDSRIFQDLSVPAIIEQLLVEAREVNPLVKWRMVLRSAYPARSYCTMYRESIRGFIERLATEEGIFSFYEHTKDGLTLVLADSVDALATSPQATVPFHRTAPTEAQDSLLTLTATRTIVAGASSIASFDYKSVRTHRGDTPTAHDHGAGAQLVATLEDYDPQTQYYGDAGDVNRYATLRMEANESAAKRFGGAGSSRWAATGMWQLVSGHPELDAKPAEARKLMFVWVEHEARNNFSSDLLVNLPKSIVDDDAALEPGTYRNRFEAQRTLVPYRPAFARTAHARPTAWGLQTAAVVGPQGEEIYTDALGRVRVAFGWHRDDPRSEKSTTWLRVASSWAGAGYGQFSLPRIGDEVLVGYLEDDIDRPVVIGRLYNGTHAPPTFSGAGSLPANRALSGIKSKTIGGAGFNELVFDDTPNEERVKLSSEAHTTQLNQGVLVHPRREGKAELRGAGFELRTDAAGAIRAPQGLLVSTAADSRAGGHQLARDEVIRQLKSALDLAQSLADTARDAGGEHADTSGEKALAERIASLGKEPAPVIVLGAPGGIAMTTPESSTVHAGKNLDLVAEKDTTIATAKRFFAHAGSAMNLFVAGVAGKVAMSLIARSGKVRVQAQSDDIDVVADRNLRIHASKDQVLVTAGKSITLTAGGAYIKLANGRIEVHAPGEVSIKGAKHRFSGPASMSLDPPRFESGDMARQFVLKNEGGEALADYAYRITREDGSVIEGVTDAQGRTRTVQSEVFEHLEAVFRRKEDAS